MREMNPSSSADAPNDVAEVVPRVGSERSGAEGDSIRAVIHDIDHALKNHIAIILGYIEVLLQECGPDDPRRADFDEIHRAALAAVALLHPDREKV